MESPTSAHYLLVGVGTTSRIGESTHLVSGSCDRRHRASGTVTARATPLNRRSVRHAFVDRFRVAACAVCTRTHLVTTKDGLATFRLTVFSLWTHTHTGPSAESSNVPDHWKRVCPRQQNQPKRLFALRAAETRHSRKRTAGQTVLDACITVARVLGSGGKAAHKAQRASRRWTVAAHCPMARRWRLTWEPFLGGRRAARVCELFGGPADG
jgi:hypothetical protein